MWLVFVILINLYLLVKVVQTSLDIWSFFEMKESSREIARIWEENVENECCQENKEETQSTSHGKHAL